jgi:hypothetical protein
VEYPEDMKDAARRLFARTLTIPQIRSELEVLYDEVPKCVIINQWLHDQAVPNEERRILKLLNDADERDAFTAACSFLSIHNFGLLVRATPRKSGPRTPEPPEYPHDDECYQCDSLDFRLRRMDEVEGIEEIRKRTGTHETRYYVPVCAKCGHRHNSYLIHCPLLPEYDKEE